MLDAHKEKGFPKTAGASPAPDDDKEIKKSLLDLLNSKASLTDLQQLKYDKTNKTDTDM